MAVKHKFCPHCLDNVKAQKNPIRHGIHIFLSVITLGAWLIVYLGWVLPWHVMGKHFKCTVCGKNVSSFTKSPEKLAILKVERQAKIDKKVSQHMS